MFAISSDDLPTGTVAIVTGIRVNQKTEESVLSESLEEILSGRLRAEGPLSKIGRFVERVEDLLLLFRCSCGEFHDTGK